MPAVDVHQRYFRDSIALSRMQVKNMISPLDIIRILNEAGVSFVLVGAHGLAGWLKKPRATQDVDVVVAEKHLKRATALLADNIRNLHVQTFVDRVSLCHAHSEQTLIDLYLPHRFFRQRFNQTVTIALDNQEFRVPRLEMALAMKHSLMYANDRPLEARCQDAHDFLRMVEKNPEFNRDKLATLSNQFENARKDVLGTICKFQAGEKLEI